MYIMYIYVFIYYSYNKRTYMAIYVVEIYIGIFCVDDAYDAQ